MTGFGQTRGQSAGDGPHRDPLAADDAWLDMVAMRTPPAGDPLAARIVRQLNMIDAELPSERPVALPQRHRGRGRARNARRRVIAAAAIAAAVTLATAGIAAADTNDSVLYPLHRVVFGDNPADPQLDQANALLDKADVILTGGRTHQGLTDGEKTTAGRLLVDAEALLATLPDSPRRTALGDRRRELFTALDRMAVLTTPQPGASSTADTGSTPRPGTPKPSADPGDPPRGGEGQGNNGSQSGQDGPGHPASEPTPTRPPDNGGDGGASTNGGQGVVTQLFPVPGSAR